MKDTLSFIHHSSFRIHRFFLPFGEAHLLDEVAEDVADEVVRLLYALRVVALDDEREVAQLAHATAVATEQTDDLHIALARGLCGGDDVRRVARSRYR